MTAQVVKLVGMLPSPKALARRCSSSLLLTMSSTALVLTLECALVQADVLVARPRLPLPSSNWPIKASFLSVDFARSILVNGVHFSVVAKRGQLWPQLNHLSPVESFSQ